MADFLVCSSGGLEWAPPVMVVACGHLASVHPRLNGRFSGVQQRILDGRDTLIRELSDHGPPTIAEFLGNFHSRVAVIAAYGYFFFTGVSVFVYIFEMVDVCQTLKYEEENVFYARLAKSLVLALEEVSIQHLFD
ncbi:hypothetical protein COOONC_10009 [Cooperia oncophora]